MTFKYLCIPALILLMISCNGKAKKEALADAQLKEIELLIESNALSVARIKIDSIHSQFPKLVAQRRLAVAFADTIQRRESARTLAYCDSMLIVKKFELDSIQSFFKFEKNEKYQENGNFVYKSQITEQNAGRNYLKSYVDEKGNLFVVSHVVGTKIKQRSVMLSVGDYFASTDTVKTKGELHSFNVDGMYYESLTFKNETENGITQFVAQNISERIKVILSGDRKLEYYLSLNDKKAIATTYHLWIIKQDLIQLEHEILKAQMRIGNIKVKYSE
jgi:hypothetical protein